MKITGFLSKYTTATGEQMIDQFFQMIVTAKSDPASAAIFAACASMATALILGGATLFVGLLNAYASLQNVKVAKIKAIYELGLQDRQQTNEIAIEAAEKSGKSVTFMPAMVTVLHTSRTFDILSTRPRFFCSLERRLRSAKMESDKIVNLFLELNEESKKSLKTRID